MGEQLKDMLRAEPELAAIVEKDLDSKGMGIADCEKKIKAWADAHKKGNFSYVSPERAEIPKQPGSWQRLWTRCSDNFPQEWQRAKRPSVRSHCLDSWKWGGKTT